MGYRGGELTDLVPGLEHAIERTGVEGSRKVGEFLQRRVRRHSPISRPSVAEVVSFGRRGAELKRKGRPRGRLANSWHLGEVEVLAHGTRMRVPVFSDDPVAPYVEWDTVPHPIVARRARMLTIPTPGGLVFLRAVMHPGTQGVHMMATALQETAAEWQSIIRREWAEQARHAWAGRA
jgi:hypothetical protein